MTDRIPPFTIEVDYTSVGWVIELAVQETPSDKIMIAERKHGAQIIILKEGN
jgi:hypothetical protein